MDWLRSEDLKEEKKLTAPVVIIAGKGLPFAVVAKRSRDHYAATESGVRLVVAFNGAY